MAAAAAVRAPSAFAATGSNGVLIPSGKRGIILYTVRDAISRNPPDLGPRRPASRRSSRSSRGSATSRSSSPATTSTPTPRAGQPQQRRGRHPAAHLAGRQRPRGRGQPRLASPRPITDSDDRRVRRRLRDRQHPRDGAHRHRQRPHRQRLRRRLGPGGRALELLRPAGGLPRAEAVHAQPRRGVQLPARQRPARRAGRPTRSSGVRRLEYFLANTDPAYVFLEMDVYWAHVAQYRWHTYTAPDGVPRCRTIFDPAATVAAQTTRFPLFHAKDGAQPGSTNGYDMVALRYRRHRLHDVLQRGGRQGLPQPHVGAGQRAGGDREPGAVARVRADQLRQHGGPRG